MLDINCWVGGGKRGAERQQQFVSSEWSEVNSDRSYNVDIKQEIAITY